MAESYIQGEVARIGLNVTDFSGSPGDPANLELQIRDPNGGLSTLTTAIVRDALGSFHYDLTLTLAGSYSYLWTSQGNNQGVSEGSIYAFAQSI